MTEAVHAAGGRIFAQLWHVGRLSHSSLLNGQSPVSSSAIQAQGVNVFVAEADGKPGFAQASMPRALSVDEIHAIVADYRQAARNAMEAGFDGVELHAANGYLVNQFIDSNANDRTDEYAELTRFPLRVIDAVKAAVPPDFLVGIRMAVDERREDGMDETRATEILRTYTDHGTEHHDLPAFAATVARLRDCGAVTDTTDVGGRPARTRRSTRATASRPNSGENGWGSKCGLVREHQNVRTPGACRAISISSPTAEIPAPTTSTR